MQKNWFQTEVTKSVDSAPMPTPAAVKANSNSLGKIAEKALSTLATAAAAALSKKSTQDALKNLTQKGLNSVLDGMVKEKLKPIGINGQEIEDTKDVKCIVHFRPHREWQGEYGFDWVRTGDTNWRENFDEPEVVFAKTNKGIYFAEEDPFLDYPYKDIVGYKIVDAKDKEIQIKNAIESVKCYVFAPTNNSEELYKKNMKNYDWLAIEDEDYNVPVLSLMSGETAQLDLYTNAEDDVKNIKMEVIGSNSDAITLSEAFFSQIDKGNGVLHFDISCTNEFDELSAVEVYRYSPYNKNGILCGKLWILPNSVKYQKEVKILLINVMTNLDGIEMYTDTNDLKEIRESMNIYFEQAMITPHFEEENLDYMDRGAKIILNKHKQKLNNQDCWRLKVDNGFCVLACRKNNTTKLVNEIVDQLKSRLPEYVKKQYKGYYKVFLISEYLFNTDSSDNYPELASAVSGASPDNNSEYAICFRSGVNAKTVTHEIFHKLGLADVFKDDPHREGYSLKTQYSSNIMDYSDIRFNTTYAQWRKLNNKIKKIK